MDNAATTKPDKEALQIAVDKMLSDGFYNPSALYTSALKVRQEIEDARKDILSYFGANYDLIFTSCGSEGDNMAVFSFGKRGNIVTCAGEHSAIFNAFNEVKQRGVETRFAPLNKDGSVNEEKLLELIDEKTTFVSIVHVNNETGAINDISRLARLIKSKNKDIIFHSDGVQAFLKIPYKISPDVDLYSVSAHKICALKGTGALIFKKNLHLKPLITGGGQEKGLRSGTENTLGISVFKNAFDKYRNVEENYNKTLELKKILLKKLCDNAEVISGENSSPYIVSLSFVGVKGEILQRVLEDNGVIVGTGSACSSKIGTSRIITNCNIDKKTAIGVIRVSFIFDTKKEDVISAAEIMLSCAEKLRKTLI